MSTRYPEWWLQRSAERKQQLDAGFKRLQTLVPQLPQVHGILVFGSYARGTVGPESDLDLIVVQDTDDPIVMRGRDLQASLFAAIGVPYDLVVYTPEEYAQYSVRLSFVRQALEEGIWISKTGVISHANGSA